MESRGGPANETTNDNTSYAPERPLPSTPFYSVEYPGYVKTTSIARAVQHLGGQSRLDAMFRRAASKSDGPLELNMRLDNPFAHPITGEVLHTNNILLKIVKRKRRDGGPGEYTAEAIGVTSKTARFRSMADYQYSPDMNDPMAQLRVAMGKMDVDSIKNFRFLAEKEDYLTTQEDDSMDVDIDPQLQNLQSHSASPKIKSNLRMFPPPIFIRQAVPLNYNYKANPSSMPITVVNEENGEEKTRMVNRMRWKGLHPASIHFNSDAVPEKPPAQVEEMRKVINQSLLQRLQQYFDERPIWTRAAILNQFTAFEAREIHNSKVLLPLVAYVFQEGPWRDCLVRFNYDPREEVDARFYQRIHFRNLNNPVVRASITNKRTGRSTVRGFDLSEAVGEMDRSKAHLFDGIHIAKEIAAFQLCDIVDPFLRRMVESDEELRDECDERDGWYTTAGLEAIKTILRHKFFSLLEGHIADEEECLRLLVPSEDTGRVQVPMHQRKKRHGKHNMAKGALPPEDAAAYRLRAQLEKKTKASSTTTPPSE